MGQVVETGLLIGLLIALLPLLGLAVLAVMRWLTWRNLPAHVVEEWRYGRIFMPEGAPSIISPQHFSNGKDWLVMQEQGLTFSRHALLRMTGMDQLIQKTWVVEQLGEYYLPWQEISEWSVNTDSDAPDYYRLVLSSGGAIDLRRFVPHTKTESDVLDAVRSIGQIPVRLRCDLD